MRVRLAVMLAAFLLGGGAAGGAGSGLPTWNEGERGGTVAGAWLVTEEETPQPAEEPLDLALPTSEEIATSGKPADVVPEKYWLAYFGERPHKFLIDPQGLLSAADYRDRLAFLDYHAGDSSIDIYVYVFKGGQEIPGEVREEELVERFFSVGRPAAVVYFYLGEPQRSVLYLSPSLTDAVPVGEQRRALESSVMQAVEKVEPSAQIEAFLSQMSIRIYWMERMLGTGTAAGEDVSTPVHPVKAAGKKHATLDKLQPLFDKARSFTVPAELLAGLLVMIWLAVFWMKRRARYRFPELVVEPRLGGAHAAGIGAVISFASAASSPASQRAQLPDFLHRT